ncbi:MAG TPA: isochorismatase family cysteine hydrolase [Acidimicrobiales bacterium]|nr:isochorismatase family cysteine hydrolase [Acidimicrobiales bacterium]
MTFLDATTPYPWPYDGCLDPERLALVIAGAQTAWQQASWGAAAALARITEVAYALREAGILVVHLQHERVAGARPTRFPPAARTTDGDLVMVPGPGDLVVRATGIDGFHGGPLNDELRRRRIDHLVLAGFGAEVCVDSTLRSANDRGYECLTLIDAVAPFSADLGRHALSSITMSGGIFGAIGPSASLLSALSHARPPVSMEAQ